MGPEPPASSTADQNVLFKHQLADVLEADGHFVKLPAEFCGELVDELGNRKSFGDVSRQVASSREVPDEQRKNLVGVDERAVAVDGADAVAIAIGAQPA